MVKKRKASGRAVSIPAGLAISGISSLAMTVLSSMIIGKCMQNGQISENNVGYWVMLQLFLITFISAVLCAGKVKHQHFLLCSLAGLLYYGILLSITALFFGGQYEAVWETGAVVAAGSMVAGILSAAGSRRIRKPGKGILHG